MVKKMGKTQFTLLIILIIPLVGCVQLPVKTNHSWGKNLEEENQQLKQEIQRLQMENQILKERIHQLEEKDLWWKQQYDALAKWYADEYAKRCETPSTTPMATPPGVTPGEPKPGPEPMPRPGEEPVAPPLPPNIEPGYEPKPGLTEGETPGLEETLLIINSYKTSGQLDLALALVEEALRENPRSEPLWMEKIEILHLMGRWKEASEAESQMRSLLSQQ